LFPIAVVAKIFDITSKIAHFVSIKYCNLLPDNKKFG